MTFKNVRYYNNHVGTWFSKKIKVNNTILSHYDCYFFPPDRLVENFIYATIACYIKCSLSTFLFKELQMLQFVTKLWSEQLYQFEYFVLFVEMAIACIGIMQNCPQPCSKPNLEKSPHYKNNYGDNNYNLLTPNKERLRGMHCFPRIRFNPPKTSYKRH